MQGVAEVRVRRMVGLTFSLFVTYVYFVAFYVAAQFYPSRSMQERLDYYQANWWLPLLARFWPSVLLYVLVVLMGTFAFLEVFKNRRLWCLATWLWFGVLAVATGPILFPVYMVNLWFIRHGLGWGSLNRLEVMDFLIAPVIGLFLGNIGTLMVYASIITPIWLAICLIVWLSGVGVRRFRRSDAGGA